MAPTLRSTSTPTTPVKDENLTPTRRQPVCKTCGNPRRGHPRSGCPDGIAEAGTSPGTNLTNALSTMRLSVGAPSTPVKTLPSPAEQQREMARHRRLSRPSKFLQPAESLSSISSADLFNLMRATESQETQDTDVATEIINWDEQEERKPETQVDPFRKVVRWQDSIPKKSPAKHKPLRLPRQVMPGTLHTPSPQTSYASLESTSSSQSDDVVFPKKDPDARIPFEQHLGTAPHDIRQAAFTRELVDEDAEALLESICNCKVPGMITTVPNGFAVQAKYAAEQVGLFTRQRIIAQDQESFLVVGVDGKEVERLWLNLLTLEGHENPSQFASLPGLSGPRGALASPANHRAPTVQRSTSSGSTPSKANVGYAAGGAAVGAAALFTTLAWGS